MNKYALTFCYLLCSVVATHANDITLTTASAPDGKEYIWKITEEQAVNQPNWQPSSDAPPPLSVDAARELALSLLAKENVLNPLITGINLSASQTDSERPIWYYVIVYSVRVGSREELNKLSLKVLLLDGTEVKPTTR